MNNPDGSVPIRVKDVADVVIDRELRTGSASLNGKEIVLGKQPIIGRVVEVEDSLEMRIIIGDTREHARTALAVFRGDEAVGVVLTDKVRPRQSHMPPRRASTSRRTICMAGRPPVIM